MSRNCLKVIPYVFAKINHGNPNTSQGFSQSLNINFKKFSYEQQKFKQQKFTKQLFTEFVTS